jgi:hypothetical protein
MSEIKLGVVLRETPDAYLVKIERRGKAAVERWVPKAIVDYTTREGFPGQTWIWLSGREAIAQYLS